MVGSDAVSVAMRVVFSSVIRDVKDKTFDSTSVFRYYKIQAFDVTSTCQFCSYI